jgi:hypothetical protein
MAWTGEVGTSVILPTCSPSQRAVRNLTEGLGYWWEVDTRMDRSDAGNFALMNQRCGHIALLVSMALEAVEREWHDDLLADGLLPIEVPDIPADSTMGVFRRVYQTGKPLPSEEVQGPSV